MAGGGFVEQTKKGNWIPQIPDSAFAVRCLFIFLRGSGAGAGTAFYISAIGGIARR